MGESPMEIHEFKVSTKRSPGYYINAAKAFFAEHRDGSQSLGVPCERLRVTALGAAIPAAAAVVTALVSEGHEVVRVELHTSRFRPQERERHCSSLGFLCS